MMIERMSSFKKFGNLQIVTGLRFPNYFCTAVDGDNVICIGKLFVGKLFVHFQSTVSKLEFVRSMLIFSPVKYVSTFVNVDYQ